LSEDELLVAMGDLEKQKGLFEGQTGIDRWTVVTRAIQDVTNRLATAWDGFESPGI